MRQGEMAALVFKVKFSTNKSITLKTSPFFLNPQRKENRKHSHFSKWN